MLITLGRFWLHDATDLGEHRSYYTATGRSDSRTLGGGVEPYANGQLRAIATATRTRSLPVTFREVPPADAAEGGWLDARRGRRLLARDHVGRLLYVTYFALTVTDYADRSGHDVAVILEYLGDYVGV